MQFSLVSDVNVDVKGLVFSLLERSIVMMNLSVCVLSSFISQQTHVETKFSANVACGRGSALFLLCTSGFVDGVVLLYN